MKKNATTNNSALKGSKNSKCKDKGTTRDLKKYTKKTRFKGHDDVRG